MSKKSSTTTSTVKIPPEVLARYNAVNARAEDVAEKPFQIYGTDPSAFVAQINAQQQQGIQNVNAAAGAYKPYFEQARTAGTAGMASAQPQDLDIGRYLNPYQQQVIDATMRQMGQANEQAQSGALGTAASSGAFGGDRAGIAAANLANQQGLAMGSTLAGLNAQNYQQALAAAQQQQGLYLGATQADLERLMQGGQFLAGLGQAEQQAALQGAEAQINAGTLQQQTEQAGKSALYNQFQQQQAYDFQVAQFLANIAMGTGALSGSTTVTTQPGSFWSDRRLKEDIRRIGHTDDGLPIYKFKYKGDENHQTHIGFMADEVEKVKPEAVGVSGGYKTVDYDRATKADGGGVAGPYGASFGSQNPYGGGYVPQAILPVGELIVADSSHLDNARMSMAQQLAAAANLGKSIQDLDKTYQWAKNKWGAEDIEDAVGEAERARGVQRATGGAAYLQGQKAGAENPVGGQGYLSDTLAQQEEQKPPQLQSAGSAPGETSSGLQNLASAAGTIAGLGTAAKGIGMLAAGTAGAGSTLMSALPFLAMSDRRMKHDIRRIGRTDHGMPIYSFKYKGDDREQTQIGFMADEVEKHHPDAVMTGRDGYKRVDYGQAHKFYQGGVVRHGYQEGGSPANDDEETWAEWGNRVGTPIIKRVGHGLGALGSTVGAAGLGLVGTTLGVAGAPELGNSINETASNMLDAANYGAEYAIQGPDAAAAEMRRQVERDIASGDLVLPPPAPTPRPMDTGTPLTIGEAGSLLPPAPTAPAAPAPAGNTGPRIANLPTPPATGGVVPPSLPSAAPPAPTPAEYGFTGVAGAGRGYTDVIRPDGTVERREGDRNWRNNNPGNIEYGEFAKANGAIGSDGRFAVFPTYEAGRAAKSNLLFNSDAYAGQSIAGAIAKYAPASDNNDPVRYAASVAAAIGVDPNTPLSDLTPDQREAMLTAMERVEGGGVGTEGNFGTYRTYEGGVAPASSPTSAAGGLGRGILTSDKPYEDRNVVGKMFYNDDGTLNRNALLSLASGIGSMLASPSQFFLPTVGMGLQGFASTYAGLEKQAADVAETKARTLETQIRADAGRFIELRNGQTFVNLGPGREAVRLQEFIRNPQAFSTGDPRKDAQILAEAQRAAQQQGIPTGGESTGIFGTPTVAAYLDRENQIYDVTTAREQSAAILAGVGGAASAARAAVPSLLAQADAVAALSSDDATTQAGALNTIKTQAARYANDLLRTASMITGRDYGQIAAEDGPAAAQILRKAAVEAGMSASTGYQEMAAALEAQPSGELEPDANASLMSGMLVASRRAQMLDKFMRDYQVNPENINQTVTGAELAFQEAYGKRLLQEKAILKDVLRHGNEVPPEWSAAGINKSPMDYLMDPNLSAAEKNRVLMSILSPEQIAAISDGNGQIDMSYYFGG